MSGIGARVPGKININMDWDFNTTWQAPYGEVFSALCDAQPPNNGTPQTSGFQDKDVLAIYQNMITNRTPNAKPGGNGLPGPNDMPFQSLATGYSTGSKSGDQQYPGGSGINNTFLRTTDTTASPTSPRLFQVPDPPSPGPPYRNPYRQYELMTKIYNSVTTRSNVFAVWITVGFFQVTDDTVRPVKLGAEIGKAEGRNVRHRMFAIIDRSQLILPPVARTKQVIPGVKGQMVPGKQTVQVSALSGQGTLAGGTTYNWQIQAGTVLVVDTGTNQEFVRVSAVSPAGTSPATVTAYFTLQHANHAALAFPGNPGPVQRYDLRADNAVVPYFNIIE
jgi:hypothetical protein